MHYGETEHRSIYGEANLVEAKELLEEGIEVHPLRPCPTTDAPAHERRKAASRRIGPFPPRLGAPAGSGRLVTAYAA